MGHVAANDRRDGKQRTNTDHAQDNRQDAKDQTPDCEAAILRSRNRRWCRVHCVCCHACSGSFRVARRHKRAIRSFVFITVWARSSSKLAGGRQDVKQENAGLACWLAGAHLGTAPARGTSGRSTSHAKSPIPSLPSVGERCGPEYRAPPFRAVVVVASCARLVASTKRGCREIPARSKRAATLLHPQSGRPSV